MMGKYVISIDQSTQGTKILLFDDIGNIAYKASKSHQQLVNEQGWISHNLEEIYRNVITLVNDMVATIHIPLSEIVGIGISDQRETAAAWQKQTGQSLGNAIVWQDSRATDLVNALDQRGVAKAVKAKTGLTLSPYFSAAKFAWMLQNRPEIKAAAKNDNLCFGTIDSWLLFRLTNGKSFKTEPSNASRTQLFNIKQMQWDPELCTLFGIPQTALPEVVSSNFLFGETDFEGILPNPIPIHCMLGDSQAALFGQNCWETGDVKATIGTGSSVMMNIGGQPVITDETVTSIGWKINGKTTYVAEGNINYAGAVISWLVNDLKLISSPADTEKLARQAAKSDQTYLVPAFTGLGAPYWDSSAKAILVGMTRTTGQAEVVRAGLESIAYQIDAILSALEAATGKKANQLKVDGGVTANSYLMQFQSDLSNITVSVADVEELSALGVALCAGQSLMVYTHESKAVMHYHQYHPQIATMERKNRRSGWQKAIQLDTSAAKQESVQH
ncbi:FGGY-family carbohydrate kinase [Pediococcus siamensis]|uniref:FGGY-family carbohydrate kinase n=1 Tax=Pediococcus siamensis TaxID=381829 RepID=UPI0039A30A00